MIVRVWKGQTTARNADAYQQHLAEKIFPSLNKIPGHRGAQLLRRNTATGAEFGVITFWDSMDAVCEFAGPDPDIAVIPPEARALLSDFEETVRHYELVHDSRAGG
jgi:heme-degrading monooxygenase HmoA